MTNIGMKIKHGFRVIMVIVFLLAFVAPLTIWMLASLWMAYQGDADAFQRLGSFGVFSWLMLLVLGRLGLEKSERNRLNDLARQTEKVQREKELFGKPSEYRVARVSWFEKAEIFTWRQRYLLALFEFVGIGVCTLQWGYGDLLIVVLHSG